MNFLVRGTLVLMTVAFVPLLANAMENNYCMGTHNVSSGCNYPLILTSNSYQNIDTLFRQKNYQKIENFCALKEHFCGVGHYLCHTSSQYITDIFNTITAQGYSIITKKYRYGDEKIKGGLLRYILLCVAAEKFKINLDPSSDMVRHTQENNNKHFDPSSFSDVDLKQEKQIYLKDRTFPAYVVTKTDLEEYLGMQSSSNFDFYNDDNFSQSDISDHWLTLSRYYSLVDQLKTYSLDQINDLFRCINNKSILAMVLKFVSAYIHNKNLTDNQDCVEIIKEIKNYHFFKNPKGHYYYGLHVSSDCSWLPYLIVALLQSDSSCPLVVHNKEHHACLDENAILGSSYSTPNATFTGQYTYPEKRFLSIETYDWNEENNCYIRRGLVFENFHSYHVLFGIWI